MINVNDYVWSSTNTTDFNYNYTFATSLTTDDCTNSWDWDCYNDELCDLDWVQNVALPEFINDNVKSVILYRNKLKSPVDYWVTVNRHTNISGIEAKEYNKVWHNDKMQRCIILKDEKLRNMKALARRTGATHLYLVVYMSKLEKIYLFDLNKIEFDNDLYNEISYEKAQQRNPNSKMIHVKRWYIPLNKAIKQIDYNGRD